MKEILIPIVLIAYLGIIGTTEFSLTGYWTDIVATTSLSILGLNVTRRRKNSLSSLASILRKVSIVNSIIVFGFICFEVLNPFSWDAFKLNSFYFQTVRGRLFNAYFKPVCAYAGGFGRFWISESPYFFPLIEKTVFYDRTVDYNFNANVEEEGPVDNNEVVRDYVLREVINKHL